MTVYYSDLYQDDGGSYRFLKRFHDFGYAQYACQELEERGQPFLLRMWDEKGECVCLLRRFRIPKLQTTSH